LSPAHFHRLFVSWAGVTPKAFLACATAEHAKRMLREGASVLDAALGTGLSGPGRLHDLCVNLEAASPGEWKNGGRDWTLAAGFAETPFGDWLAAEGPRGICHLAFAEPGAAARSAAWDALRAAWPRARIERDDVVAARVAALVFARHAGDGAHAHATRPALRAFVRGTAFQVRVWRALLRVRPGTCTSYGRLAASVGRPGAARAIGSAAGQNPLAVLIPCHRVIRETGALGGYRWDPARKRALLAWEHATSPTTLPHDAR
jgi:AraC family transcriptional regulator of adaptative response/methylated-DNA-[protein]-cysteine methyltransferase